VDRAARRLAGYRYGRQIADDYLTQLGQGEQQVARWLEAENDPVEMIPARAVQAKNLKSAAASDA
ncbi:hypothetical protein MJH54_29835, partial [Salmonella enterica subsp. enterica serovar Montevideo]|nr:hypothetical protein [Salmonella enterica subsp. enterica serovar Montevideo]